MTFRNMTQDTICAAPHLVEPELGNAGNVTISNITIMRETTSDPRLAKLYLASQLSAQI